ncbi:MAG: alpha/beta hydrolase [Acidimicrobiia bacterium]
MRIETLLVDTIDGLHLEADLALPAAPRGAVAIAHPHPQFGGDRLNPVVDALFRSLPAAGFAALRFDFRGVGNSEGTHGEGVDERLDMAAAIDAVAPFALDGPLVAAGYSFGALVALQVADPRLSAWVAIAPPLGTMPADPVAAGDHRPTYVLVPAHDQFTTPEAVAQRTAGWQNTTVEVVEMADHFFGGRAGVVALEVVAFVSRLAGP